MTDLRKAAEMALEALESFRFAQNPIVPQSIYVLRQALAQPEQEHKPWVSLTEEESSDIYNAHHNTYGECITSAYDLVLDVEAKLKEKNGG